MLWSLIKIVVFVILVAAAATGATYLLDLEGGVRVAFAGIEVNLTPLNSVIALVLLVLAVWLFLRLAALVVAVLRFINGDETAISRYFDRNRERKGFQALSEGLLALASGEGRLAMAKAAKAEKFLHKPELTNLLTAQAAEMSGDHKKAEQVYKRLLADDATRFVGVRGIMKQKLSAGDTDTALKLAQKAFAIKPRHGETQDILLKLQAEKHDWKGARETLSAKLKSGALPRDVHKRRDAVLALSEARDVMDEGKSIEAREAAIEANRLSPDLVPAACLAARSHIEKGKARLAARVLKKAWAVRPHPDLAAAFAEIAPDETPEVRLKRFAQLIKANPDHRESKLLQSELYIAAEDFPAARRALGDLAETAPDARVLTIMAAVERGEGASDAVVEGWLTRALAAPRGPQWVCDKCHNIHREWVPVCENCHSFDTLSWTTPPAPDVVAPTGAEMLPLIVGPRRDETPDEDSTAADVSEAEIVTPEADEADTDAREK
ncbi:MAG: heme biosynthesis HemY N-terminal domain-containing protein [Sediminimonas sp.]|uniref:heme biosynthesis protein HemY n=1 Tax=Sediminimonas sp. TaxID=2823379 RepID=UPI002870B260|nr:heme biosynthesis HemY N-terminal domain-containing protein [Sediminimonas sp.]MDR9484362.1 heme biosynthesis HemY N-terminal domain-containing protein [Sediminimonas sp.]